MTSRTWTKPSPRRGTGGTNRHSSQCARSNRGERRQTFILSNKDGDVNAPSRPCVCWSPTDCRGGFEIRPDTATWRIPLSCDCGNLSYCIPPKLPARSHTQAEVPPGIVRASGGPLLVVVTAPPWKSPAKRDSRGHFLSNGNFITTYFDPSRNSRYRFRRRKVAATSNFNTSSDELLKLF